MSTFDLKISFYIL